MNTTQQSLNEVLRAYIEAWNNQNVAAICAFYTEGASYHDVAAGKEYRGKEIAEYLKQLMDFGVMKAEAVSGFAWHNNMVAYQERTTGHSHAGEYFELSTAEFMEFEGDKIAQVRTYYDFGKPYADWPERAHPDKKYQNSGLTSLELLAYKNQLQKIMDEQKLYRKNTLSLKDLAAVLKITPNHLSQVINSQFNMGFFEFIHSYRIDEAISILQDKCNRLSVLDIAESLGFNSSSTFYTAFKKRVGMTPKQYRKQYQ